MTHGSLTLGIFEVGHCNDRMAPKWGRFPPLFQNLLSPVDAELEFAPYRVIEGVFPDDLGVADGWLIPGSAFGVYDETPWLGRLQELVREAYDRAIPLIGVCYGHQLIAHTLGGRAEKSDRGWGVGAHRYETFEDPAWFGERPDGFTMHVSHQDQVVELPPDARVLARSEFCPYAALAIGPGRETRAITVQAHPEFDAAFEADLIESRRGRPFTDDETAAALATVGGPVDNVAFARWFARFLRASV